jgi:sulfoquinovose isomerase
VAAGAFLNAIEGNPIYEQWYRRILNFTAARFIDRDKGWRAQISDALRPNAGSFSEKLTSITLCRLVLFQLCQRLAA